jgi:hypothetical protein
MENEKMPSKQRNSSCNLCGRSADKQLLPAENINCSAGNLGNSARMRLLKTLTEEIYESCACKKSKNVKRIIKTYFRYKKTK